MFLNNASSMTITDITNGRDYFRYLLRRGRRSRAASKYVVIFWWRCPVAIGLRFTVEADWW